LDLGFLAAWNDALVPARHILQTAREGQDTSKKVEIT
jgi:hypothetical protein